MRKHWLGASLLLTGALLGPKPALAQGIGNRAVDPNPNVRNQAPDEAALPSSSEFLPPVSPYGLNHWADSILGAAPSTPSGTAWGLIAALPEKSDASTEVGWESYQNSLPANPTSSANGICLVDVPLSSYQNSLPANPTGSRADFLQPADSPKYDPPPVIRGQGGAPWDQTGRDSVNTPVPTGSATEAGVFGAVEFLFMTGTRAIGNQDIAFRGFVDSDGSVTGQPSTYVGTKDLALSTSEFGAGNNGNVSNTGTTWAPGYRVTLGYRFEDGLALSVSYAHLFDSVYSASAAVVPPNFNPGAQNADSFLFSPVSNFSPQFSGPPNKVSSLVNGTIVPVGDGSSPYGIWNGASQMDISFLQRFSAWDITARMPLFETDYSRSYGLAGARFDWIWERFGWNTQDLESNGGSGPQDSATYSNIISQRMYGPFIGTGNEIYLGSAFALSFDVSAAALYGICKERAAYELNDGSIENKHQILTYELVPEVQASVNLTWYPIRGIEVRTSYNFWGFFNTQYMQNPVAFNQGYLDPEYGIKFFRLYQGVSVGVSYSF